MADALRAAPAVGRAIGVPRGVRLTERDLGKIDLRGDPEGRPFMAAVGRALDLLLPTDACTSTMRGDLTALWLGPDQWLLTCPPGEVERWMESLGSALGETPHAVTDVSDARVTFRLAGPSARDVLAKGCPLDLDRRVFVPGQCAASGLAKADVLLHLTGEDPATGPVFDVHVARSFARYLFAWLADAGLEYGVQVDAPG